MSAARSRAGHDHVPAIACTVAMVAACAGGTTRTMGEHTPFAGCDRAVAPPPAGLGLDPFYTRYLDGYGTPVVSSSKVSVEALVTACRITGQLVAARADVRQALAASHFRIAVLGLDERTTDIPEYADLYAAFPDTDWNETRGLGATRVRPVSSCAEENLRCLPGDIYPGQVLLVQMAAHGLRDLGIAQVDNQFMGQLRSAYAAAMDNRLWTGTYATTNPDVYWAIGTQAWFRANATTPVEGRAAVTEYDPPLAALLAAYLPPQGWQPDCY